MKKLIILFFLCISFEMFAQPIVTSAKVMKFPDDYINKYNPPLNIPPKKGGVSNRNKSVGAKPIQKPFSLYDSIPFYFNDYLSKRFGGNPISLFKSTDTINVNFNFTFSFDMNNKDNSVENDNKGNMMNTARPTSPTNQDDYDNLRKMRKNNWIVVGSGAGCQVLGVIALTKIKPISINNNIIGNKDGVKATTNISGNSANNLKWGIIGGTLILGGSIMEVIGGININNINIELNKFTFTF